MNDVFIALGSNIGEREEYLRRGLQSIGQLKNTTVKRVSSIYETEPVGFTEQAPFLNMVAEIETAFSSNRLLEELLQIEKKLDRTREIHWGPRTLDLDILLYNQENIQSEELKIPHPRMLDRGFVMIPLYELQPDLQFPHTDQRFSTIIEERINHEGVNVWKRNNGVGEFGLFEN
ncbi:2-amino-4-hydroxy-6-hydroxymethyldihydropteridine diphosphokinase [Alkalihalobacillus sp. AL-G]|uniref:2-amino-4-hydroxy-6- hydroxymethyldihydropteridine diphosphokinase n=1 Tax=Alkalihalobacillus sp. AL-G TaxID=2926399 RepID=UPI00272C2822|nr:2-amino-4-hydroxy-6-hydroxymethyldihydropteridine diphosphokinase [Alkalihalobacillus sp. AL-G]WLD93489.1 2-amino-4-hydroxy-6-hydroxymethyldihydropteridine diphosphokinase [Alkalihalobacillus sp. AL-G]